MQLPALRSQATHPFAAGEKRLELDGFEAASFEQPLTVSLEFPSLAPVRSSKRSANHHASKFPAKRRKGAVSPFAEDRSPPPEREDDSWIDNFSLLDSIYPEDSPRTPANQQQQEPSVTAIIKQALTLSADDIVDEPLPLYPPVTQGYSNNSHGCYYLDDSHWRTGISSQETRVPRQHVRAISETQMAERTAAAANTPVVTPLFNSASSQYRVPPIAMSRPAMPSVVDCSAFTISKLKQSKEPTLLTLTSYPYRVVYSNEAFSKMSGSKTSVIGDSIFDAFKIEGSHLRPCLATYPTLVGRLENEVALVPSFTDDQDNQYSLRCGVQAFPVTKRDDSSALRYYAIRFTPLLYPL